MALTACAKVITYAPTTCSIISGGISDIFVADATLFDFTQAAPTAGVVAPYTAITDLGTSTKIYPVKFEKMSASYDFDMKNENGVSPAYTHKCMFSVPRIDMLSSQWAMLVNQQGYCCGILVIMILNSGDILIMGEGSVNTVPLVPNFYTYQDGTKGTSGKKGSEKNTVDVTITSCEYFRPLIQYVGATTPAAAIADIMALSA